LEAHTRCQVEFFAVFEFDYKLTLQDKQDMTSPAPVIRPEPGRIFYYTHPDISAFKSTPEGSACFSLIFGSCNLIPIGYSERNVLNLHDLLQ
jgi:hypothetical protein